MAKIRVYELAKQVNMSNKMFVEKLNEMNIAVKSHMSVLDEETATGVKQVIFGEQSEVVVEKRVKGTVIRRRRQAIVKKPPKSKEVTPEAKVADEIPSEVAEEEKAASAEAKPTEAPPAATKGSAKEKAVKLVQSKAAKAEKEKPAKAVKAKKKPKIKKEKPAKIVKLPEAKPEVSPEKITPKAGVAARSKKRARVVEHIRPGQAEEVARPSAKGKLKKKDRKQAGATEKDGSKKKDRKQAGATEKDRRFLKKKITFRKKEVLERDELYSGKATRGRRDRRLHRGKVAIKGEKPVITTPKAIKRRIRLDEAVAISDLAKRMGVKANEVIKRLMSLGLMASLNQAIDFETATLIANEFDYEVEKASFEEEDIIKIEEDDPDKLKPRPPVVTIMGHVDHGKTSLLDVIRETNVTEGEAGGITQHIGAYCVNVEGRQVVFLDTPGHEAFTAMRARGAELTDQVVLVVAADDGVMPQTVEAINHAKAAEVPIIVAVNKIDKAEANTEMVQRQLADHGLTPEAWGGDTISVAVSAKEKTGVDELLEMILLQADVLELKANPDKLARGHVVEAQLDPGRGAVATVLVEEGTLRAGDPLVCGLHHGKVRAMVDDRGTRVDEAGPSIPVEIQGLSGVPMAGDEFVALDDEKLAKQVSFHRSQKQRVRDLAKSSKLTLEKYFEQMQDGLVKDLNLIIRADVQGSIEAISEAVYKIPSKEVKVNIVHSATGAITESDTLLATVSKAIIVGFNVRPNPKVGEVANEQNVDIRFYDVIYNVINDIKAAMVGLMDPTYEEHPVGRAEVRETFSIPKVGTIAGSYVTEGKVVRGQSMRLLRDGVVVYDGKVVSLHRFKDDAKEVQSGYECGLGIENFNDVKVGDVIECYRTEEIKPVLE